MDRMFCTLCHGVGSRTGFWLSGGGEETRVCHGCAGTGLVPDPGPEPEFPQGGRLLARVEGGVWDFGKLRSGRERTQRSQGD